MNIERWNFGKGEGGELLLGGMSAVQLTRDFGTPLHVVDETVLKNRAAGLKTSFMREYPDVTMFYAMKANSVAGVARTVFEQGYGAEIMSEFELWLAQKIGTPLDRIVANGPNKGETFLRKLSGINSIVVDSISELKLLDDTIDAQVLLRVNPDFVPKGMNTSSATGSRKGSVFGIDLHSGELATAFEILKKSKRLRYAGIHAHIGTGIRCAEDYARGFEKLSKAFLQARSAGFETRIFDFGGGFGLENSKEFDTLEFLAYQGWGKMPRIKDTDMDFAKYACTAIKDFFKRESMPLPKLYLEPGRAIVSPAQVLLLTVGSIKERPGVGKWIITDGGAGTCAFPLYYEFHEVLLANNLDAPLVEDVTMVGPVCFSSNWIYRKKRMPQMKPGDVIAIMDTGAYFIPLEANFGFQRTPVVMVSNGTARLIRKRESFEEMAGRDVI